MNLIDLNKIYMLRQWFFTAIFSFPFFSITFIHVFFIAFSTLTLVIFLKEKPQWRFSDFKFYLIFIIPFLPYFVEFIFYSKNEIMQFEFEKKILFFIAPLFFYMSSLTKIKLKIRNAIICFIVSVTLSGLVSLLYLMFYGQLFSATSYLNGAFELRHSFEQISGQHPIYFGLFCTTASLWMLYKFDEYSKYQQWLVAISLMIIVTVNLLIAAKMPLLIFIIGILWIVFKKIQTKKKLILLYFMFFISISLVILFIPSLNHRLSEFTELLTNTTNNNNTILERYVVYSCSKLVFAQDFWIGVGSRNAQSLLDFCYVYFKFDKGYSIHLNSHNQYLSFGIRYGVGLLLIYITSLIILYKTIKNNIYGVIYFFCSAMIMLTESILERQMGIYYYLFFGLLFLTHSKIKQKHNEIKCNG